MEALGGLLIIAGLACAGGGLLMDTNIGRGTTSQSAIPLWRNFRRIGFAATAVGFAAWSLGMLLG